MHSFLQLIKYYNTEYFFTNSDQHGNQSEEFQSLRNDNVNAEPSDENKKGEKSLDVNSYLESLYQDLDNIVLDSNQNPTASNFNLSNGLLLSRIKALNEVIQTKNLHIKVCSNNFRVLGF